VRVFKELETATLRGLTLTKVPNHIVAAAILEESDGRKSHKHLRANTIRNVQARYLEHADEVRKVLVEILKDTTAKDSDRISAGNAILNRAIGLPVNMVQMNMSVTPEDLLDPDKVAKLSDDDIAKFMLLAEKIAAQGSGDILDITPEGED